jgi:hypothetical protein
MRLLSILGLFLAVNLAGTASIPAQSQRCQEPAKLRSLSRLKAQPNLGIDFKQFAAIKVASRKTRYRMDEIINLDIALLNQSSSPTFFRKNLSGLDVDVRAYDEDGKEVDVKTFQVSQLGYYLDSYSLLGPGLFVQGTVQLLPGCEERAKFEETKNKFFEGPGSGMSTDSKGVFEQNLFANWGDACLDIKHPGDYTIVAEVRNEFVVVSPCEKNIKTAVGTIRSTPLKITISD